MGFVFGYGNGSWRGFSLGCQVVGVEGEVDVPVEEEVEQSG
jgi:hypothetical protein